MMVGIHYRHKLFCSVTNLCPTVSNPMDCSTRLPCPSLSPGVCSNSCPLNQWCLSNHLNPLPPTSLACTFSSTKVFPMSQLFTQGGQSTGALSSVLPMNTKDWFPLGLTGLISMLSKWLSRVFSSTILKHRFFGTQSSLWSNAHIRTWLLEKP